MDDAASEDQNELPSPTAPDTISVSLRDFNDAVSAEIFGYVIAETIRSISRIINLERLDGITVAFDYDRALADLDRGYQASRSLQRTSTEEIAGVAMAPAVLRNGTVKSHIVFHAPFVLGLQDPPETDQFRSALYIVGHECGHVNDLKYRDEAFPGMILQHQIVDVQESTLEPIASGLWEEYVACRLSALLGQHQTAVYEETFASVLAVARGKANAAIRAYRVHANVSQLLREAGEPICQPFRVAAYLLGHLDGLGAGFDEVPHARDMLAKSSYASHVQGLHDALQDLWSRRGHWASTAEFDSLRVLVRNVFAEGGLVLHRLPNGEMYVDVPFTPETTPL